MSGYLAGKVWHSALEADLKPLAATLADIADDDGSSIYPSVAFISWRLGRVESCVREGLQKLREKKILIIVKNGGGRGNTTEYFMNESALPQRPKWSAKPSDNRRVSEEENPPVNTHKPSGLGAKPSGLDPETLRSSGGDSSLPVRDSSYPSGEEASEEGTPSTSTPKPSPEEKNPEQVFRQAKAQFRQAGKGKFGELSEANAEVWATAVSRYGSVKLLGALALWTKELTGKLNYPVAAFLKRLDDYVEDFEIEVGVVPKGTKIEDDDPDGSKAYSAMLMKARKELNERNANKKS
jgi:hypothetical protein